MKVTLEIVFDILPTTEDKKRIRITSRQAKKFIAQLWNTLKESGEWERRLTEGKEDIYVAYAIERESIKTHK